MNINKDILNELLAKPEKIEDISLESLENLANEFPYFIGIHKLINSKKRLIKEGSKSITFVNSHEKTNIKYTNDEFDKEDDDEFTELEVEEMELPFDNFESAKLSFVAQAASITNTLSTEQIATLHTLAGNKTNYFNDDLSLLPHLENRFIEDLANIDITSYLQLINIIERNGDKILEKAFEFSSKKVEEIATQAKKLFLNKYQKLLLEELGFSSYKNKNNLKKIVGIGNLLESKLNQNGIFTFQQIINLNEPFTEILTAVIDYFTGRIERDNWKEQAEKLSKPDEIKKTKKQQQQSKTIEHLAEKLEVHKENSINFVSNDKPIEIVKNSSSKTFLGWLKTFDIKKKSKAVVNQNREFSEPNNEEEILEAVQPRLVKVDEDNLNEIHTFLGNKTEDYKVEKPVFQFLPGFSVKEVAAKSLEEDKSIVSITLAKIYEQQAYFDKAVNIYQKLILKYPEKSSFFAAQIKVLEEKI